MFSFYNQPLLSPPTAPDCSLGPPADGVDQTHQHVSNRRRLQIFVTQNERRIEVFLV
jgi:hypothetical protein